MCVEKGLFLRVFVSVIVSKYEEGKKYEVGGNVQTLYN